MNWLVDILIIVISLFFLLWSADFFIDYAAKLASHIGMSALMVGVVIVGFGTSAPEIMVSVFSALKNQPGIALGNAYGSNIANIGLVLGITLLFFPLTISKSIASKELPLLMVVILICGLFFINYKLSSFESMLMLAMVVGIIVIKSLLDKKQNNENKAHKLPKKALIKTIVFMLVGLFILLVSSKFLVDASVNIAKHLGVSDLVIGLTIIAIGTSLPELASSIAAVRKKYSDIVLGNIIGSCLFNALAVVGIAGMIEAFSISHAFLVRDFLVSVVLIILLWLLAVRAKKTKTLKRWDGILMFGVYIGYSIYLLTTVSA